MSSEDKHPIRNAIISTVIAGIILLILPFLFDPVKQFFKSILTLAIRLWYFLLSDSNISWILVLVLVIFAFPTLLRIIVPLFKQNSDSSVSLSDYRQDVFEGVNWKWTHLYAHVPVDPEGFCPICGTRLIISVKDDYYKGSFGYKTEYLCEHCNRTISTLNGDPEYAISRVKREIERRINTDEWKTSLKPG